MSEHGVFGKLKIVLIFLLLLMILALWFQHDATTAIVGNVVAKLGMG